MSNSQQNAVVWFEIPVTDLHKSKAFYEAVTGATLAFMQMGPDETVVFKSADMDKGVGGHLYLGKPANDSGATIHLSTEGKLEDTIARTVAAGGTMVSEPVEIPAGRFAYAKDLDGNSIGLFEVA